MKNIYVKSANTDHKLPFVEGGMTYNNRYVGQRDGEPFVEAVQPSGLIRKWLQRGYLVEVEERAALKAIAERIAATKAAKDAAKAESANSESASRVDEVSPIK